MSTFNSGEGTSSERVRTRERGGKLKHEQGLYHFGSFWGHLEDGTEISGDTFGRGDEEYILIKGTDGSRSIRQLSTEGSPVVENPEAEKIMKEIEVLLRANEEITNARKVYAKELAKGDSILEDILLWHMDFTNGRVEVPSDEKGIKFYQVGRNASHAFYAGTKDGKKYSLAIGEAPGEGPDGDDEKTFGEVKDWDYMGHY